MEKPVRPLFLERKTYRHRRMVDAARLLPILGALLFFIPTLWTGAVTSVGVIYLFAVWAGLIVVAMRLAHVLAKPVPEPGEEAEPPSDPPFPDAARSGQTERRR